MVGKNKNTFKLYFSDNRFKKNDILTDHTFRKLKIISEPKTNWCWKLLKKLTFGLVGLRWYYKVEIVNKEKELEG